MARSRRPGPGDSPQDPAPAAGRQAVPGEGAGSAWTAALLAAMMFLVPTLGVPHEEMLQDTLKSIVVSFSALTAALLFFVQQRRCAGPLRWHGVLWLPLLLCAHALGSMAWSHAYLAGVEAVRWFVFALILWLGLNTLSRERLPWLAWGIHAGALGAATWAALQFWADLRLFPQGPQPASTFVNRNFFAEFAVSTLPFGALLLARARQPALVLALAASCGFLVTTILMTGTRGALIALWLQLLVVLPLIAWRCRRELAFSQWQPGLRRGAVAALAGTVLVLGSIPSGNPSILAEQRGQTPIARAITRTQSIGPSDTSLNIRFVMWQATMRMVADRPLAGVGAGAWENVLPLYQSERAQLETDYYAHNEILQLLAEYGVAGWIFLVLLFGYLIAAAWHGWRGDTPAEREERPWRAAFLCSLLAFLVVSNIGFPWRLAATGALFALCLAGLAASDARLGYRNAALAQVLRWSPRHAQLALAATVAALVLALFITHRAAEGERKIVGAAKIALTITASGRPHDPRWAASKAEMLRLAREGIALNPHYRKITPMIADELARWGDWANATWIWESVAQSRPYVVAILGNVARGYSAMGDHAKALAYLERAKRLRPASPTVRSLEVILLGRSGQEEQALQLARAAIADGIVDQDLLNAAFILFRRAGDHEGALRVMDLRLKRYPESRVRSYMQLGALYDADLKDRAKAVQAYRQALAAAHPQDVPALLRQVPAALRDEVAPAAPGGAQTSSSKE